MPVHDWSTTSLGPPETWPRGLRAVIGLMLASKFPMFSAWGPELSLFWNDACTSALGPGRTHALGRPIHEAWPEFWSDIRPHAARVLAGEPTEDEELRRVLERHGFPVSGGAAPSLCPIQDESGAVIGLFCACSTAVRRVLAEQQRAAENERLRGLFQKAPGFMCVLRGPQHVFEMANESYFRLVGHRDLIGKPVREALPELTDQGYYELLDRAYTTGETFVGQTLPIKLQRSPGGPLEDRRVTFVYQPIQDEDGEVCGLFVEGHDVTEARLTEEALRRSQEHLSRAQQVAHIGSWEFDLDSEATVWSPETYRIFGVDPEDFTPTRDTILPLYHPDDRPVIEDAIERAREGRIENPVVRIVRPDGSVRWISLQAEKLSDGRRLIGTIQDITERREAEASLARALALNGVTNAVLRGIASGAALQDSLEAIVRGIEELVPGMLGSILTLDRSGEHLRMVAAPSLPPEYVQAIDGIPVGPQAGSCGAAAALRRRVVVDDIATHPNWDGYREHALAAGLAACWAEPILDGAGRVLGTFAMYYRERRAPVPEDLAVLELGSNLARIALERDRQEEQLRQSQKMEAVGQLTGGIAHDFNNLLAIIIGNLDLLAGDLPGGSEALELLDEARRAALRGSDLTARLLAFSRRQTLQPRRTDVARLVREHTLMLRRLLRDDIVVRLDLAPDLWPVHIDPSQLETALTNLATNARDAMPAGGVLRIGAHNVEIDATDALIAEGLAPGSYVRVEVEDTGSGMSPEVLARVFEPFFTTKATGKGSGLGLPMVYGFAKQSGGHFVLASAPGKGATATLYLPRADTETVAAAADGAGKVLRARPGETVLVVDDNEALRAMAARQLRALGYSVMEAADGPAALALIADAPRVDAVLTDVLMPGGLSGVDLVSIVRERHPGVRTVLMSGYPQGALGSSIDSAIPFLRKPFRTADLAALVRNVLDGTFRT